MTFFFGFMPAQGFGQGGLKKSILFLIMREQAVIVRIAIILSEGGNGGKKTDISDKIRKNSRKGIGAHCAHRQPR